MTIASPESIMIQSQLLTGHVLGAAVLDSIQRTPRSLFLPESLRGASCVDEDLEVAPGRFQMEPLAFARLVELAAIQPQDRVLVVGCLTGYSVCVLAHLAAQVMGIEEQRDMAEKARQNIRTLGINNAEVFTASLTSGYQVAAPYDVIFIEGAIQQIPQALQDQLSEHGRLVAVEALKPRPGSTSGIGRTLLAVKREGKLYQSRGVDASVSLLPGFSAKIRFQF